MQRLVIAVVLSGLLAACGQQSGAGTEAGAPVGELDYIDAVPIDEDAPAPVVQPEAAAKADEPEEDSEPKAEGAEEAEETAEVEAEPVRTPSPEPAAPAPATTAAEATRRANESTATPYLSTPRTD